jgi:predicted nucleotidyltransferase
MKNKELKEKILKIINIKEENIYKIYIYGSRLYETNKENSDYDVYLITNKKLKPTKETQKDGIFLFHSRIYKNHCVY